MSEMKKIGKFYFPYEGNLSLDQLKFLEKIKQSVRIITHRPDMATNCSIYYCESDLFREIDFNISGAVEDIPTYIFSLDEENLICKEYIYGTNTEVSISCQK